MKNQCRESFMWSRGPWCTWRKKERSYCLCIFAMHNQHDRRSVVQMKVVIASLFTQPISYSFWTTWRFDHASTACCYHSIKSIVNANIFLSQISILCFVNYITPHPRLRVQNSVNSKYTFVSVARNELEPAVFSDQSMWLSGIMPS